MNKPFICEVYHIINGLIKTIRHEFHDIEEAICHAEKQLCHSFKIFDKHGCMCHSGHKGCHDTYA